GELRIGQASRLYYSRDSFGGRELQGPAGKVYVRSDMAWEHVAIDPAHNKLSRNAFRCDGGSAVWSAHPGLLSSPASSTPELSVATPPLGRSLYVYNDHNGLRIEACYACLDLPSGGPCP